MKKNKILVIALVAMVVGVTLTGCGGSKPMTQPAQQQKTFKAQTTIPCMEFDTDEYYTGYGSFYGSYQQVSRNLNDAMRLARTNLVEKLAHEFNGFVEQSAHSEGTNRGNDQGGAVKSAGLEVIEAQVARLRATCSSTDETVDANGNVTVHVGIQMTLKDISQALMTPTTKPKDNLTKEEKAYEQWKHEQSQEQLQKYLQEKKSRENQ